MTGKTNGRRKNSRLHHSPAVDDDDDDYHYQIDYLDRTGVNLVNLQQNE